MLEKWFDNLLKLSKALKKKNKVLEIEFKKLSSSVVNDHSTCVLRQNEIEKELERNKKEFSYVVGKF